MWPASGTAASQQGIVITALMGATGLEQSGLRHAGSVPARKQERGERVAATQPWGCRCRWLRAHIPPSPHLACASGIPAGEEGWNAQERPGGWHQSAGCVGSLWRCAGRHALFPNDALQPWLPPLPHPQWSLPLGTTPTMHPAPPNQPRPCLSALCNPCLRQRPAWLGAHKVGGSSSGKRDGLELGGAVQGGSPIVHARPSKTPWPPSPPQEPLSRSAAGVGWPSPPPRGLPGCSGG